MKFEDIIKEEIVLALTINDKYTEKEAKKFADKYENRISEEMWTTFDNEVEYLMSEIFTKGNK